MEFTPTQNITLVGIRDIKQRLDNRINEVDIHELAVQYMQSDLHTAVGTHFRIEVANLKERSGEYLKADFSQYKIFTREDGGLVYKSDKLKYYDPSSSKENNAGNQLIKATVIEDTETAVTFAFITGADELCIYKFKIGHKPVLQASVDKDRRNLFQSLVSQKKLLPDLLGDNKVFETYTSMSMPFPWQTISAQLLQDGDTCVMLSRKRSMSFGNGAPMAYRFHVWDHMRGICRTEEFYTGFKEEGRYHSFDISFNAVVEFACEQLITLRIEVFRRQKPEWKKIHTFHVFRERPGETTFEQELKKSLFDYLHDRQLMRPEVKNGRVTNFAVDNINRCAACVLAETLDGDQTRYSVWCVDRILDIAQREFTRVQDLNPVQKLSFHGGRLRIQEVQKKQSGQIAC